MKQPLLTYQSYLQQVYQLSGISMHAKAQQIINQFRTHQVTASRFAPVLYIVDYTTRRYLYVDEACVDLFGIKAKDWIEEGLDGYLKRWHPADHRVISDKIFPVNMEFIKDIPFEQYASYVFSHNHRTKNASGEYITVLQRSSFIPSNIPGIPMGNIGVAIDLTHFKSDLSIIHTIEEINEKEPISNRLCYKKVYPLDASERPPMSQRETEILHFLSAGMCSKQIAAQLHISINTVNNHRKNMLGKTGSRSSAELLRYAATHGYLAH